VGGWWTIPWAGSRATCELALHESASTGNSGTLSSVDDGGGGMSDQTPMPDTETAARTKVSSRTLGTASLHEERLLIGSDENSTSTSNSTPAPAPRRNVLRRLGFRQAHIGAVGIAEDAIHYGVALVLMVVAAVVLYRTTDQLVSTHEAFDQAATTAVNGVLFAIIIMEVMRTVMAHFDRGGLQLQPFLIIGIISAVREILSVGAHLSLSGSPTGIRSAPSTWPCSSSG
jgi:uncharacterized membrane protein (DUF373 family)